MSRSEQLDAVVLRTIRYGEGDIIAHVFSLQQGQVGVIAKGARKPASRLGARLEPFLVVRLQTMVGRGDLATVRGVDVTTSHDAIRRDWRAQQLAAAALDLVRRVSIEHEPNASLFHLLCGFLSTLAGLRDDGELDDGRAGAVLVAFELKALHALGLAPQLGTCVRCGEESHGIAAFSADDGGVVCRGCRVASDQTLDVSTLNAARLLMQRSLAVVARMPAEQLPANRERRTISNALVAATLASHLGTHRASAHRS